MRMSSRLLSAVATAARTLRPEADGLLQRLQHTRAEAAVQVTEQSQVSFGRRLTFGFAAALAAGFTLSSCDDGSSPVMERMRQMWEEDNARRKDPILHTAEPERIKKAIAEQQAKAAAARQAYTPAALGERPAKAAAPAAPAPAAIKTQLPRQVVFVLGGPGSGKGTQCSKLLEEFDMAHLSAGDLLRAHINSGSPDGQMVAEMIKEGKIVPSEVTIALLQQAMDDSGKSVILVDGFPRNIENRDAFERVAGYDCTAVLYFECPEEVLEARLLARNQGRTDDNIESIKKRFRTFIESSLPVVEYYTKLGKVKKVDTNRPIDVIYEDVKSIFEVVDA